MFVYFGCPMLLQDKLPYDELKFGKSFSDHMLEIDWDSTNGWQNPVISPYHYFSMSPAATALHYGIEVTDLNTLFNALLLFSEIIIT